MSEPHSPVWNRSLQLTFSFSGSRVTLESARAVETTPFPSEPLDRDPPATGFWYELHDARGRVLYRCFAPNPIARSVEVPTGNPEEPLQRRTATRRRGTFFLLAPEIPEARQVVLFSSPLAPARQHGRATELARFELGRDSPEQQRHQRSQ